MTNNFSCTFDDLSIEVVEGPENSITAGPDQVFCGDPVQLQGAFVGGGASRAVVTRAPRPLLRQQREHHVDVLPDNRGRDDDEHLFYDGQIENFFDHIQVFDGSDISAAAGGPLRRCKDVRDGDQPGWVFTVLITGWQRELWFRHVL